jgi:hypothetical protein
MGAKNQVGIGLSYRPARPCSLATQFQTRFLESIPRPIAGLKFSAQYTWTLSAYCRFKCLPTPRKKPGKGGEPKRETQLPQIASAGNYEEADFLALSSVS